MKTIFWSGREWATQEDWGIINPSTPYAWTDADAVSIDSNNTAHVLAHHNPRNFILNGVDIISNIGTGMLHSIDSFQYGHFEIECKLPDGEYAWPAFWLYCTTSWPPEIDIFEGWSRKNHSYLNFDIKAPFRLWKVSPDFHFGYNSATHTHANTKGGFFGFKNPKNNFLKYEMIWTPDKIEIIYNGYTVQVFDDSRVIGLQVPMRVLISTGVTDKANDMNPDLYHDFQVSYFKYTPL